MVQLALFSDVKKAIRLSDTLRRQGLTPRVVSARQAQDRPVFQVHIGPFPSYDEARRILKRWRVTGHTPRIVRARD